MTEVTLKSLLEAGVHFGHQAHRWNPKMAPFLFDKRSNVHIINLEQTLGYLHEAQKKVEELCAGGGTILFVGTKRQGKDSLQAAAERCQMPFVTERWLGGMLTNFTTIKARLDRLAALSEEQTKGTWDHLPKKELARKRDELRRLTTLLGGARDLQEVPAALFINDVMREDLAVKEARKLGLPIIGVVDSNADPTDIDYPIPANDDAVKAIAVVAEAIADAVVAGREKHRVLADKAAAEAAKAPKMSPVKPEKPTTGDKS